MNIKFHKKPSSFKVPSLEEAHRLGLYTGSISRDELMQRITRYNPQVRWIANEKSMGLFHTEKGFICAISRDRSIPMFSFFRYDPTQTKKVNFCTEDGEYTNSEYINRDPEKDKMLARGWPVTLKIVESKGLKIDRNGLSDCYFWDYKWKD